MIFLIIAFRKYWKKYQPVQTKNSVVVNPEEIYASILDRNKIKCLSCTTDATDHPFGKIEIYIELI
jgi:hypothetical protein